MRRATLDAENLAGAGLEAAEFSPHGHVTIGVGAPKARRSKTWTAPVSPTLVELGSELPADAAGRDRITASRLP